jgi:D-beta-D-heptose 7-phosphate kinase / D-beta-D-heptose 1-phosphate adenosyltransferase
MNNFINAKVLVIGDVMLDEYWSGNATRISPEAPVPVVNVLNKEVRAGGAANVAMNITALGGNAHMIGVIGKDVNGAELASLLEKNSVSCEWLYSTGGTIAKLRILSHHQQLIRMDFENKISTELAKKLAEQVAAQVADYDVIVLSDYAKGTLQFVEIIIKAANLANVPVFVDPKEGDFKRYYGATLIKPNQAEFETIVGECENNQILVAKAEKLSEELALDAILITRSEHGMVLLEKNDAAYMIKSKAQDVFDVTGAGDTVMATLATAYASGIPLKKAMNIANIAASIVVAKVGTATVSKAELDEKIQSEMHHKGYVAPSEKSLLKLIKNAQNQNEKIVITNGCFDILHSGHVRYLNEAAKAGDRLIVAVNSDESVRILKGSSRPIVPLNERMELLAALSCVDWVISFNEETPERLICKLQPDVLVKGGDYCLEQIAGAQCVWNNGGKVEVLSFWNGYSTSKIIEHIKEVERNVN